ncbi:alpha/beta hydrolase [Brachybacterium sp. p3-SID1565]|uniref:alpha/beta fold hydrolase n=1 Tax=Brachybacterium sp. p3-SID1565 TaxID=2916046 RepID=UPI0021A599BF|nr:alpha/beta hydrolase [Brachybacterium sp. p3-SID1565]MCT1385473.1 alpha/beta hydrolase [Brachybacterium sp. p3-SID1565]
MDIILLPGLWLDGSVWEPVLGPLREALHRPFPLTLPGQGAATPGAAPAAAAAGLDDQLEAALAPIDAADDRVLVVGHSAASTLAWMVADRRVDDVAAVVMIGGMPAPEGEAYAGFAPVSDGVSVFPGWEAFAGPDSDDLDAGARAWLEARMHPLPESVTRAPVHYTDPRRHEVPVAMVCPEYSPEDARQWLAAGDLPELEPVRDLRFVDLDSGHWPMASAPRQLAGVIAGVAADLG